MSRRLYLVLGHPVRESFCGALADAYEQGAREHGAEVRRLNLAEATFSPIQLGYNRPPQALEPDLQRAQEDLVWAEHVTFVWPLWWSSFPALFKGYLDRVMLPGFAFKYLESKPWFEKLLTGRTGRTLVTMDIPPFIYRWLLGAPAHRIIEKGVLDFCGIAPAERTLFGPVRQATPAQRTAWLAEARNLGVRDATRPHRPRYAAPVKG